MLYGKWRRVDQRRQVGLTCELGGPTRLVKTTPGLSVARRGSYGLCVGREAACWGFSGILRAMMRPVPVDALAKLFQPLAEADTALAALGVLPRPNGAGMTSFAAFGPT